MEKVGVLGCGWLGLPLALELKDEGYQVRGTVTSESKAKSITSIDMYSIQVTEEGLIGDVTFFDSLDRLLIAIPPGLRSNPNSNFVKKIAKILEAANKAAIEKIIYVSTIAVFPNDNQTYDELSKPVAFDDKSKQLIKAEELILQYNKQSSIIRMGGLVNQYRHPVTMLAKKQKIQNPKATINLIHLVDAIGVIKAIIRSKKWLPIYHGVFAQSRTKKEYYSEIAKERGLKLFFDEESESIGKKISSAYTVENLQYVIKNSKLREL